jgi:hypothetical protein
MSDGLHWAEMSRLDAFDEEFAQDPEAIQRERRRRIIRRLWTIAAIVLGVGTIAGLALAWTKADGRLRLELQSVAPSPRGASREPPEEELNRLHREVDALRNEVADLTQAQQQAQQQAAEAIAALQAAEQDARSRIPPPAHWYSNPAALSLSIAGEPPPHVVPPRQPPAAGRTWRNARPREQPGRAQAPK